MSNSFFGFALGPAAPTLNDFLAEVRAWCAAQECGTLEVEEEERDAVEVEEGAFTPEAPAVATPESGGDSGSILSEPIDWFDVAVAHPAASQFLHPRDSFWTFEDNKENIFRLCTMVSCPRCPASASPFPAEEMAQHLRSHCPPQGGMLVCSWLNCGKRCGDSGTFKRHVDTQHLKLRLRHCRYCHADTRYGEKGGHDANVCPRRADTLAGRGTSAHMAQNCSWCQAFMPPQYGFQADASRNFTAKIVGPGPQA
ncbi:hypothetical protein BN946_scf184937.g12 [Trametes cinnabarina]|uniref:C2H2-type domain-containing protein n=1 Tax=Pycnoporus cinnabarinus TaxID=5643 RepID=A0A060SVB2_PYCCI|nr:hypothetical protein BN946_scf184937.g12 [Trametes cinnabarina]